MLQVNGTIHRDPAECNDSFRSIKGSVHMLMSRLSIEGSSSMRGSKCASLPRWDMSRRLKAILAKIEFSPQLPSLRPVPFPFHSLLSVFKSHPKGPPCLLLLTKSTIRPLSRYPSIDPRSPFHFVLIERFLGRLWGLPHLPHAMLGAPQERSRRH